ncbi:NAD(P)/FAD-dependent oxidoreductase [uncultured Imperialibacter sp.]|uniref:NAD(P)/FAD-dependent oxidoreductase n=1 Tax=uncultured Imperialibacter sp. TaxID=1672639 RepID=UPI0030D9C30C|tara:strand:- start:91279 stop:92187 length:909 start_codon:yes stop_codon:yes gene_type:complete
MDTAIKHDVIIVGGSYAGLAAGLALGRALRKVLIIDSGKPCNRQTPHSHNFLTQDGTTPAEIASIAKQQVLTYDTVSFLNDRVQSARKLESGFEVFVPSGESFTARKLVFATGIKDVMPEIPGFKESWGKSVLHCPYCHGYEVRGQKTGILANGDSGYEFCMLIANWTSDLTLYTNGSSTLTREQTARLQAHQISIVEDEIEQLEHTNGYLNSLRFKTGKAELVTALYARLPFQQHCDIPQQLGCELGEEGYIKVDAAQKTSVPGVYACGDNITRMRTVANAVSMGTTTGLMVNKELVEEEF